MTKTDQTAHINKCLSLIEEQLSWGGSHHWSSYDFEKLSELIWEKTNVRLSKTTLKRVWGKIKYEHAPTTATLNVLAQFAGFEDWRNFAQQHSSKNGTTSIETILSKDDPRGPLKERKRLPVISMILIVAVLTIGGGIILNSRTGHVDTAIFAFKADKVSREGVPNSVVFTYDASKAKTDSVFIIQTWDIRRKTLVPKNQTKHSAIYFYPGYFRTKLIVDGEVVKTHDLEITSQGWLGLVRTGDKPFYFDKKDITKSDGVEIDEALMQANHFELTPVVPKIHFFNEGNITGLMNDNFEFETTLRNNYKGGNNACQYVEVLIQCVDDIIIIPLVNTICTGDATLYVPGKQFVSKSDDLTGFGANLSEWTTLKVACKDRVMHFFVNGKKAFEATFTHGPAAIVGLQYRFNGCGAIKETWLKDEQNKVIKF
jgi:hypothetical protein